MKAKFKLNKLFSLLLGNFLVIVLLSTILSLSYFDQLNNLFLDNLQGDIRPRSEILIIGIDDTTLSEVGAWPWSREIFAKTINELNKGEPKVVSFDILFLEERNGDQEFQNAMIGADFPIVLGSKLVEDEYFESIYTGDNIASGYTNFIKDKDGIIRRTTIANEIEGECELSLSFSTLREYLAVASTPVCGDQVGLDDERVYDKDLRFNYTNANFSYLSFVDVYEGNIDPEMYKNKIIMIGATPIDLKTDLLDNFTDVFGQTTPGVFIHANIVNSFLQGEFRTEMTGPLFFTFILLFTSLLLVLFKQIKNNSVEFVLFILSLAIIIILGILIYNYGTNFLFLHGVILVTASYVYYVAYKYLTENRQKQFLKKAFGQYISPKLLGQLMEQPGSLKLGGVKKEITVLFTDIQGFTTISEKLSPEELINLTNKYFDLETGIILENGGTIDKYIGDCIMAFWNAPVDDKNHKLNALRACLAMKKGLEKFNADYPDLPDIDTGIGLNTDLMIVGNVGSSKRFNYTLIGDGVNLASRVEGLTRKYKAWIIVTENVVKNIDISKENFIIHLLDEVLVKGKHEPIKLYAVLEKTAANEKTARLYEKALNFYGKGDFEKVEKHFKEIKDYGPASSMLERIPELKKMKDWDGIWKWTEK